MSVKTKLLSALMAFCLVFGTLISLSLIPVAAADDSGEETEKPTINYLTDVFETKEAKLATMTMKLERYGYRLYRVLAG